MQTCTMSPNEHDGRPCDSLVIATQCLLPDPDNLAKHKSAILYYDFLRCTFGILLLFLALEPEATSICNREKMRRWFINLIFPNVKHLKDTIEQSAPECNQSSIAVFCNPNQNEAIEFIYNTSCQLERISRICNYDIFSNDLMDTVAQGTFKLLKNCTSDQRKSKSYCHGTGGRKRLCPICRIKEAILKFYYCWTQFVRSMPH